MGQSTGYGLGERGSVPGRYKRFTSYPKCPERLWGLRSFLGRVFARELIGRGVKLLTHFHLVLRLRMSGGIPLLRYMSQLSSMQSACAVLYCRLWPLRLYSIFPHHVINGTIYRKKKLLNIKCVLIFSTTFVRNISHSKKIGRDMTKKNISVFMYSTCYSCQI